MPKKDEPLFAEEQPPQSQSDVEQARSDTGGVELEFISDYWPPDQPEPEQDPKKPHRENRIRAGEKQTIPAEQAFDLLERGVAKRVRP